MFYRILTILAKVCRHVSPRAETSGSLRIFRQMEEEGRTLTNLLQQWEANLAPTFEPLLVVKRKGDAFETIRFSLDVVGMYCA